MNRNVKKITFTVAVTGGGFVLSYLITFFLTPFITESVGTDAYGFVSLAKNTAQYATYITAALNTFASRFISVEYHNKDYDKANTYFSSTYYGDLALGSMILTAAMIMIMHIDKVFRVPAHLVHDVQLLFVFVFIKFWIQTILSVNEAGVFTANALHISSVFHLFSYVVEGAVLIALFSLFSPSVYYVGIALLAGDSFKSVALVWIRKKYTPYLKADIKHFDFGAVKNLVGNGIWQSLISLGAFLNSGLDLIVCNRMLSALAMGKLAIAENIALIFKSLITMVARPFHPYYLKDYADRDMDRLKRHMIFAMKFSSMFTNTCFAGMAALGLTFYRLWIPAQDIETIWKLTMISSITAVSSGIITPGLYGYTLTLKKKIPCALTLMSGVLNVLSMYFLIKYTSLGVYAVVWTTAVLMSITNLIIHPFYIAKVLSFPRGIFYPVIVRCLIACAAVTAALYAASFIFRPQGWMSFAVSVIILGCLGFLVHLLFALTPDEKKMALGYIGRKSGGKKA